MPRCTTLSAFLRCITSSDTLRGHPRSGVHAGCLFCTECVNLAIFPKDTTSKMICVWITNVLVILLVHLAHHIITHSAYCTYSPDRSLRFDSNSKYDTDGCVCMLKKAVHVRGHSCLDCTRFLVNKINTGLARERYVASVLSRQYCTVCDIVHTSPMRKRCACYYHGLV